MAGPYRSNVIQGTAGLTATFDPPLDAIHVTASAAADSTLTISGEAVTFASALLSAGDTLEIGGISRIVGGAGLTYVGLREKVNSTITDSLGS